MTIDGKNQESTAEAVNAYYAVFLLGLALGNKYILSFEFLQRFCASHSRCREIRDFGRLLLATEIRSTHTYYHISNTDIYPPDFAANAIVGARSPSSAAPLCR